MYHNFVGIDIGKFEIAVAIQGVKAVKMYKNEESDLKKFYQDHKKYLQKGLVVLETTGGYEKSVVEFLLSKKAAVHRANTRIVKNFIRSLGKFGKSDKIDAQYLAEYGKERHKSLPLYEPIAEADNELLQINNRIQELKHDLVREKNRLQAPDNKFIKTSIERHIIQLQAEIELLQEELNKLIDKNDNMKNKIKKLEEIVGVGKITAVNLILAMPELGNISNKAIASLAGVAPHPNESGNKIGYRKTVGGRRHIRPTLYLASMAASRSHSPLGDWYRSLIARGKKPIVALVALARKIIVLANATLRDLADKNKNNGLTQNSELQSQIKPA
jgi:transposase